MLVYGDAERLELASDVGAQIARTLRDWMQMSPGIVRHSVLVGAFIRAGELAQGLLDARWQQDGADEWSADAQACSDLLLALAQLVARSWAGEDMPGTVELAEARLTQISWPVPIRTKMSEGYAFYALYPESYLLAAQQSVLGPETVVLGIRSIGTSLSAMVAAGLGAQTVITLRPHGHPYDRQITVAPALATKILADPQASFAIVDEGPGLSGSSFGGVADWLESRGVAAERIHFFPSHGGDLGPQAKPQHRERWARAGRHHVTFAKAVLDRGAFAGGLRGWAEGVIGPLEQPLHDISGGGWRARASPDEASWPPADTALERRKFLARSATGIWLVKWAGLGQTGKTKLARARRLAEAGWTPEVAGLCHGFLVQRWAEGASLAEALVDREWLLEQVGRYLGFRARALPAPAAGASLPKLFAMARYNIGAVLGDNAAERVGQLLGDPERLAGRVRPVHTDNRIQRWEWLVTPDQRLSKTDALDHDAAHDLVGCQDLAWDLAGAAVEFALAPAERDRLAGQVAHLTGCPADPELSDAMELCYLGFQVGLWSFAAGSNGGADKERAREQVRRYTDHARTHLI